jgi:hypothetical protein
MKTQNEENFFPDMMFTNRFLDIRYRRKKSRTIRVVPDEMAKGVLGEIMG